MAQQYDKYKFPIKYDEADYARMMPGLLPKGIIWGVQALSFAAQWLDTYTSTDIKTDTIATGTAYQDVTDSSEWSGGKFGLLLSVIGSELSRIEADAWDVLNGTDPGVTTGSFLADWERNLRLPDSCAEAAMTVEERQLEAHTKKFSEYVTTTVQSYINFAASLGYTVTVDESPDEYQPRLIGQARVGRERLGGLSGYLIMGITITAGDGTANFLECKMNKFKPAHAILLYTDARP